MPRAGFAFEEPVVPMHLPATFVSLVAERGVAVEAVLAGTAIRNATLSDPESRISYAQIDRLVANAFALTGDPALGLAFGRRIRISRLGVLGFAVAAAPTLADAIGVMMRYHKVLGAGIGMDVGTEGELSVVRLFKTIPLGEAYRFNHETWSVALARSLAGLIERELPAGQARFDYPAPSYADLYAPALGLPAVFGQEQAGLVFDRSILGEPLPSAAPAAFRQACAQCDAASARVVKQQDLPSHVRGLIAGGGDAPPPLDEVARRLGLSRRTLNRRLADYGTSFRLLFTAVKRDRAITLVRDSSVRFDEIADRLGFSDYSNFLKSFKRWTGKTPAAYRNAAGG